MELLWGLWVDLSPAAKQRFRGIAFRVFCFLNAEGRRLQGESYSHGEFSFSGLTIEFG